MGLDRGTPPKTGPSLSLRRWEVAKGDDPLCPDPELLGIQLVQTRTKETPARRAPCNEYAEQTQLKP